MASSIQGKVHYVGDLEHFGPADKQTAKRIVAIEVKEGRNEEFVQYIPIEWTGDNAGRIGELDPGQEVEIMYNLRGREWKAPDGTWRYFATLAGWKWQVTGSGASTNQQAPVSQGRPSPYDEPFHPANGGHGGPTRRPLSQQVENITRIPNPSQQVTNEDDIPF